MAVILREQAVVSDLIGEPLQAPHSALEDPGIKGTFDAGDFLARLVIARGVSV
jgi:hypothetical protein